MSNSKYLTTAGKDYASFSKNVHTNDFDFIFDGFDFDFDVFDFDFDGFDFGFDGFDFGFDGFDFGFDGFIRPRRVTPSLHFLD
ncbi:MAG: hypothetical protein JST15_04965 [Bacteroidetes bacterium]|nr:hypothetical protein [Bacteroidota bacterium]